MKTFVGLFASSASFSGAICLVYWFSSHDKAGTFLLGFMMLGFCWAAGYSYISEKDTNLVGDRNIDPSQAAGEDVGIFTKHTPWPFLLAISITVLLVGVVWSSFLIFAGLAGMLLCLWRLGAESARVGRKRIATEEGTEDVT